MATFAGGVGVFCVVPATTVKPLGFDLDHLAAPVRRPAVLHQFNGDGAARAVVAAVSVAVARDGLFVGDVRMDVGGVNRHGAFACWAG